MSRRGSGRRTERRPGARLRVRVLAGGLMIGLVGCTGALRKEVARQDAGLSDLRGGVDRLRADLRGLRDEVARQDAGLSDLRGGVDGLRADLRSLRDEAAGLRAALEAGLSRAAAARQAEEARVREGQEAITARLATAERRAEELADGVTGLEVAVATLAEQFARLEAGSPGTATLRLTQPSGPRQAGPPISAEELFDRGMESFRAGELGQAVLDFEEFAEKHPTHPLAASTHFWIGEAYFRSRDFEHAATEYQKAVDLAATGERTPDALLRLGLALRSLRREDRAREVWARLVRDFPDSEAALRARAVLRQPGRMIRPTEPR